MPDLLNIPDVNTKTDEELITATLLNQEIFGLIIRRYEAKLLRYVRTISNASKEEAEDILQESFIKAYRNLNGFDVKQKFSSWMYRIVHNEVISHYRKLKVRAEGNQIIDDERLLNLASGLDIHKDAVAQEQNESIRRVLDTMDPKYRDVLILKFLEEKEYNEISYILHKPMGTVATLINRAKKQFRIAAEKLNISLDYL